MTSDLTTRPAAPAGRDEVAARNAEIAADFLTLAGGGQARRAWDLYGSDRFVHHNPFFRSDGPSLIAAMDENARQHPGKALEVRRTIAEGPFVVVHSIVHQRPPDPELATVHIFRIEDGRIRELWDVAQEVPSKPVNEEPMV